MNILLVGAVALVIGMASAPMTTLTLQEPTNQHAIYLETVNGTYNSTTDLLQTAGGTNDLQATFDPQP